MITLRAMTTFVQGRLSDTNANLVARSLIVAAELAAAMGPAWDRTARDFLKPALEGLADKKKQVCIIYPVQNAAQDCRRNMLQVALGADQAKAKW